MADNVQITPGSGVTVATEDVSGVQHQKMKVEFGGDGVATLVSSSNPLPVDGSGVTQPVSASSLPLPTDAATSANQTDGSQKTQIVDAGGEAVTVTGGKLDVNASASLSGEAIPASGATTAVTVQVVDGSGNQITSFGGGTQYTEGDTDASITGTAMLMEGAGNALVAAQGTASDGLLVNLGDNNDITGTVTANAGTNLNTSALALETTATSIKTAVETIDNAISGTEMQVDVLTMPTTTVQATNLDIRDLTSASDSIEVKQATGTNLHVVVDTAPTTTVSATNLDVRDLSSASDSVSVHGDVGVIDQIDLTNSNPAVVAIVDGNGDQIVSFGGGTQYSDADANADPTGTVSMGTDGSNVYALHSDTSGDLQVDVLTMPTTTVQATNLDIRDLTSASDSVEANQATAGDLNMVAWGWDGAANRAMATDAAGNIQVDVLTMPTVAVTQSGTWDEVGINDSGNSITVDYATTGSGTATGALRVELPTNGTGVIATVGAVTAITNALPAGTNAIGKLSANSGVDIGDVDVTSISAGSNLIGDVSLQPRTGNGCSLFRSIDLDESEEEIKATAGNLYGYYFANTNASARYLKLYNATAANVTVGTTTPVATFYMPPTSAGHVGLPYPISFATAISAAATTGVADNDTGAPGANEILFMAFYK